MIVSTARGIRVTEVKRELKILNVKYKCDVFSLKLIHHLTPQPAILDLQKRITKFFSIFRLTFMQYYYKGGY